MKFWHSYTIYQQNSVVSLLKLKHLPFYLNVVLYYSNTSEFGVRLGQDRLCYVSFILFP